MEQLTKSGRPGVTGAGARRARPRWPALALALAAATSVLVMTAPAEPPTDPAFDDAAELRRHPAVGTFDDVVDVREVNLEVTVSERGRRIAGLRQDDFELRIDGRRVPITHFAEIDGGTARSGTEAGPDRPMESGVRLLVVLDDFFAVPTERNRILRHFGDQLASLGPADRVAVMAFDGRHLVQLSDWSGSKEELRRVFEEAQERAAYGLRRLSEQSRGQGSIHLRSRSGSFSATGFFGSSRLGDGLDGALTREEARSQVSRVLDAAISALEGSSTPPPDPGIRERHVLMLLSGGWPETARLDPGAAIRDSAEAYEVLEPLIEAANRLGYSVYPVDVAPLRAPGSPASAARPGLARPGLARPGLARPGLDPLDADLERTVPLEQLASETGGVVFRGGARWTSLERAVEDARSYYWIGFAPPWPRDDSVRSVDVRVRGRGRVRSRRSFTELPPSRPSRGS